MSDFEALSVRLAQTLSELAETQDRLSKELARGLVLSTGMMRDLSITLTRPAFEPWTAEPSDR